MGHGRQPDRQDPVHDRRPGRAAARHPHRERRRAALRRPAQPEHRELGDGHPGPQGRRARDARRHARPDGGCDPRSRTRSSSASTSRLFATKGEVPDGEHVEPLGRARIVREGTDCTIVALAGMVPRAAEAAERLAADHGISAEVIDLRTLVPLDVAAILARSRRRPACSPSRRTRACVAGAPRSCRSWPTRASGRWTRRSCASRPRTCRWRRARARGPGDAVRRPDRGHGAARSSRRRADVTRVGVLGTGRMGSAFARALARDGHEVLLWNRTLERCYALAGQLGAGVRVAGNAAEVAANTDVTLSMVADGPAVTAIYKARTASSRGRTRAGCWSISAPCRRPRSGRSSRSPASAGAGILDSPVSGSVGLAEAGELTLMVGGSAEDLERARPALEPLAQADRAHGPAGQWRGDEAGGERGDLRPQQRARGGARPRREGRHRPGDSRTTSSRPAPSAPRTWATSGPRSSTRTRRPSAFALELAEKDLGLITGLADEVGTADAAECHQPRPHARGVDRGRRRSGLLDRRRPSAPPGGRTGRRDGRRRGGTLTRNRLDVTPGRAGAKERSDT